MDGAEGSAQWALMDALVGIVSPPTQPKEPEVYLSSTVFAIRFKRLGA